MTTIRLGCNLCEKHFSSKLNLNLHIHNVHGSNCPDCNTSIPHNWFTCEVCKKCYAVEDYLNQHIKALHMLPKRTNLESTEKIEWKIVYPNKDGRINCLDCMDTFSSIRTAKAHHSVVHTRTDKFICQVCNKSFAVDYYLKLHLQSAHMLPKIVDDLTKKLEWKIVEPNEDGRFSCLDCNETYSSIKTAKAHHSEVHTRTDKFICKICDKGFSVEDYLKLLTH